MSKYLYPIYKLKTKSYIRWWLYNYLGKFNNYVLSEILIGTSFYLEDSTDRKFNIFDMIGRTTQESTTGKNLLDSKIISGTKSGLTFSFLQDTGTNKISGDKYGSGIIKFIDEPIIISETGDYSILTQYFSGNVTYPNEQESSIPRVYLFNDADGTTYTGNIIGYCKKQNTEKTIQLNAGTYYIGFLIWGDHTIFNNYEIGIDIVSGSNVPSKFEKYTGGEPAPNPKYPFPIKNTGDNGSVNENVSNSDGTQEQNISFPLAQGQKLYEGEELKENGKDDMFGELVFTGTENYDWKKSTTYDGSYYFYPNNYELDYKEYSEFKCSHAICVKNLSNYAIGKCFGESAINLWLGDGTQLPTPTAFKAYLAEQYANGTPVTIVYKKANPTITPYTEEQKTAWEQIKALRTYKNITHISSEDETPAELKIQYWKKG